MSKASIVMDNATGLHYETIGNGQTHVDWIPIYSRQAEINNHL